MAERAQDKIFTKDFVLLFVANFTVCSVYFLLITVMALYAIDSFACSDGEAGLAASIFMLGGVIGRIVSGQISHDGLRKWTFAGFIVMFVSCLLYFVSSINYVLLLAIRMLHGVAFGITGTLIPAMIAGKVPMKKIGEATGYFSLSVTLGTAIGPMLGLFVVSGMDYQILFVLCTAVVAIGAIASFLVPDSKKSKTEKGEIKGVDKKPFDPRTILDPLTRKFSFFMLIMAVSYMPLNSFINNYAAELGMGYWAPFLFLVYAIGLVVTRPIAGKLFDKYGENLVIYPSIIFMAIGLVLTALVQNPFMLLSVGLFMALGFGTAMSVSQAQVTRMSGGYNASRGLATMFLLADLGGALGPFLLGFVANAFGFREMYAVCALVALLAFVYYHFAHGRFVPKRK